MEIIELRHPYNKDVIPSEPVKKLLKQEKQQQKKKD